MSEWYVETKPALIHGAFTVSLITSAALVAIWAAISPRHRLLRTAGFCALPIAMALAPAPRLAIWLLAEMAPISAGLIVGPFVARAPFGRSWAGIPKLRFGFRDLFFVIFLIALALSGAMLLDRPDPIPWGPWYQWLMQPLSLWLPACGAAMLVLGTGSRRRRVVWMVAACAASTAVWYVAILRFHRPAGVVSGQWYDLQYEFRFGGLLPCLLAAIVVGWLSIWRKRRPADIALRPEEPSPERRPRLWAVVHSAVTALIVAPACVIYYELARPIPIPKSELPTPNGYDRLVAIGHELSEPGITPQRRDELVLQARHALRLPSRVTVNYASQTLHDSLRALRCLGRALHADGQGQETSGDAKSAAATYLDLLELGDRTERGGTYFDLAVGIAFQSMAARSLSQVVPDLSADECRELADRIQRFEVQFEPLDDMLAREYVHARHNIGWYGRWFEAVETLSGTSRIQRQGTEDRGIAQGWLRVLVCELAVQRFYAERGRFPDSLDELVPVYLGAIPDDPFDGQPIKFSKDAAQYTICTTDKHLSSAATKAPAIVRPISP